MTAQKQDVALPKSATVTVSYWLVWVYLFIGVVVALALAAIILVFPSVEVDGIPSRIEAGESYTPPAGTVKLFGWQLPLTLSPETNLDTQKAGSYTVSYAWFLNQTIFEVAVVDALPPVVEQPKPTSPTITTTTTTTTTTTASTTAAPTTTTAMLPITGTAAIEQYITDHKYDISVGYYNLVTGKTYTYRPNRVYYSASLIKTLDALYIYDNNMVNPQTKECVKKAITVSDNTAHHQLVDLIGRDKLRAYGKSIGANRILTYAKDYCGEVVLQDQLAMFKRLYAITKDGKNEELKSFFINQYKNFLLFDGAPPIMHKYGSWEKVFHNSGIVLDAQPYIVVILTNEGYDDYPKIVNDLSRLVYAYHQTVS